MTDYAPTFQFYSTLEEFAADTPTREVSGTNDLNLIYSASFKYHRHGGCLDGEIKCTYEFTTLIRDGWYVRARMYPDGPVVYAGRVIQRQHNYQGEATLLTYGLIRWFNARLTSSVQGRGHGYSVVARMAAAILPEVRRHFNAAGVLSGAFSAMTEPGPIRFKAEPGKPVREQIAQVAALAGDAFYGFIPDCTLTLQDDLTLEVEGDHFVSLQGDPAIGRVVRLTQEAAIQQTYTSADDVVNHLTIYGDTSREVWSLEDSESIAAYGFRPAWYSKPGLTDKADAILLLSVLLEVGKAPSTQWAITLTHTNDAGDTLNMIENGIPFPWAERLQVMGMTGADFVAAESSDEAAIEMGADFRVTVSIGTVHRDLVTVFGLQRSDDPPGSAVVISPSETAEQISDIAEPPVGFYLNQLVAGGVSKAQLSQAKVNYDRGFQENYYPRFAYPVGSVRVNEIVGDTWTPDTDYDYLTYDDLMTFLGYAATETPDYYDSGGARVRLVDFADLERDGIGWFMISESGETEPRFMAEVNAWITGNWTGFYVGRPVAEETAAGYRSLALYVPNALLLHFAGTLYSLHSLAAGLGYSTNWAWLIGAYGGYTNIYAGHFRRYPYQVTFSGTPSGYLPADYASRAVYFTLGGAAAAAEAGYYWEEIILTTPTPGSEGHHLDNTFPQQWGAEHYNSETQLKWARTKWTPAHFGCHYPVTSNTGRIYDLNQRLADAGFRPKLIRKKRMITGLTRISEDAHRLPRDTETTAALTYGLPRYGQYEYRVRGYDDDHASTYVDAA